MSDADTATMPDPQGQTPRSEIEEFAARLEQHPHQWQMWVGVYRTSDSARAYAYRIRKGKWAGGQGFDATYRKAREDDPRWRVFIRYTGWHLGRHKPRPPAPPPIPDPTVS